MQESTGCKIRRLRKQKQWSAELLAEKIGKDRATIYRYESNDIANIPIETLHLLADALEIEVSDLLTLHPLPRKKKLSHKKVVSDPRRFQPTIGHTEATVNELVSEAMADLIKADEQENKVHAITVETDSLNKVIPSGSTVAIQPVPYRSLTTGDLVLWEDFKETQTISRVYKSNQRLILRPESSNFEHLDHAFNFPDSHSGTFYKVIAYFVVTP